MSTQPMPTGGRQDVHATFLQLVNDRYRRGVESYGTPLRTHNGRDAVLDALEEVIDLGKYLTQVWLEWDAMRAAVEVVEAAEQLDRPGMDPLLRRDRFNAAMKRYRTIRDMPRLIDTPADYLTGPTHE